MLKSGVAAGAAVLALSSIAVAGAVAPITYTNSYGFPTTITFSGDGTAHVAVGGACRGDCVGDVRYTVSRKTVTVFFGDHWTGKPPGNFPLP